MRVLLNILSEHIKGRDLAIAALPAILHIVLCGAVPLLAAWALYMLTTSPDPDLMFELSVSVLCIPGLRYLLLSIHFSHSYRLAFELGEKTRLALLRHLRRMPLGAIKSRKQGELIALFNDDIKWLEAFIGGGASMTAGAIVIPAMLMMFLLFQTPKMALLLLSGFLLGLPCLYFYNKVMAGSVARRTQQIAALNSRITEHFTGMPVLRVFNAVGQKDRYFRGDLNALINAYKQSAWKLTPLSVVSLLAMESALAPAAYFSLQDVMTDRSAGLIVICTLFLALSLYNPLLLFFAGSGQYRLAQTAAKNINRFLDLPTLKDGMDKDIQIATPDLHFENVSFGYNASIPVVENISFTAKAGELTAIVGPSGAGKTTLFSLATRFWDPDMGNIYIGDQPVDCLREEDLCRYFSVVTQETLLIDDTIRRNIDLGIVGYPEESLTAAIENAQIKQFITETPEGLESRTGQAGTRLSGGQKQRITIARALLKDAPIILLDEAMASVDPINARQIQKAIARLTRQKTVLVIAHRLSTITNADKIIVMESGRILSQGTHQELLEFCDLYKKLWADHQETRHWNLSD